ncbi:hypothetical protein ACFTY8_18510 [Streptomyces mirabilis]|uniref:hypothetical protein n=1 Tax=Streptomyces mirabilis TaxID=68239 RepID=UPI0036405DDC
MGDQVAVPSQHGVWSDQQSHLSKRPAWQALEQRSEERPVARVESHPMPTQLPLQHGDLVAQGQDLYILLPVAHRQQSQHRERVRHAQVRQSQQTWCTGTGKPPSHLHG